MHMRPLRIFAAIVSAALAGQGCQSGGLAPPRQNTEAARAQNEAAYKLIVEGKFNEAEDILRNAKAADVMYGPVRSNLGLVYLKQHKLYEAAWEFENAIK